jgi:hypothetical protein
LLMAVLLTARFMALSQPREADASPLPQ